MDVSSNDRTISICIPTYRRPQKLLQALQSCVAQDYRPLDVVISDDSPDNETALVLDSFASPSGVAVRYKHNVPGLGQAANVNSLFACASGARLILLHDDDLLLPNAVSVMNQAWHEHSGVVAVYGKQDVIDENGALDSAATDNLNRHYKRTTTDVGLQRDTLVSAFRRQFPNDGYLVDTAVARKVGYRSFEEIGDACDADFAIRLALHDRSRTFVLVDNTTGQYRVSSTALSGSRDVSWRFFNSLLQLNTTLSAAQHAARTQLLREIAVQATVENALRGNRASAWSILSSRYYPWDHKLALLRGLYHFGLILVPQLNILRPRRRRTIDG